MKNNNKKKYIGDMETNLKCKNCGYEIALIKSWDRIEFYHTGVEERMPVNRLCRMVHRDDDDVMNFDDKAELTDEDLGMLIRQLFKGGGSDD